MYIQEADNQIIGNEIQRLCVMADIQQPELPKHTVEFFRDTFKVYPIEIVEKAFNTFLAGKLDLRKPPKINSFFLSKIMRSYIAVNGHNIETKKPKMLFAKSKELTNEELMEQKAKVYNITYQDYIDTKEGSINLYPKLMEIQGKWKFERDGYPIQDFHIRDATQWLENYIKMRDMKINDTMSSDAFIMPNIDMNYFTIAYVHFNRRELKMEDSWM